MLDPMSSRPKEVVRGSYSLIMCMGEWMIVRYCSDTTPLLRFQNLVNPRRRYVYAWGTRRRSRRILSFWVRGARWRVVQGILAVVV